MSRNNLFKLAHHEESLCVLNEIGSYYAAPSPKGAYASCVGRFKYNAPFSFDNINFHLHAHSSALLLFLRFILFVRKD